MQQDNPVLTSATGGRWKNKVWVLLGALAFWSQVATADQAYLSLRLTIYATPSCTINNNYAISVNFGDILSTLIDGANYKKEVLYNLSCSNLNGAVTMNLSGAGATFAGGSGALRTDINDLGIAFYTENTRLDIGSNFNFSYNSRPRLYAVPIKATGVTLTTGGDFTAGATLIITYN
ncbi:fimbrial protein [Serratia oryzae]|uniref:fimbrial protein n=1 Tax=Serratia oryzae TaxID=2034155 RepID=UPI0013018AEC|nr:fimbrial protein [Serratia oryzae]